MLDTLPRMPASLLLSVLLLGLLSGASPTDELTRGPAERIPPRPVEVSIDPDPPSGFVRLEPALVVTEAAPGDGLQPVITLRNGGESEAVFAIDTVDVAADEDGAARPIDPEAAATTETQPSAATWITLAEDEVVLGPSEQAQLRPALAVPDDAPPGVFLAALRARPAGEVGPAAIVAVRVIDPDVEAEPGTVTATIDAVQRGATATVRLQMATDQLTTVHGRLDVRGWWGLSRAATDLPPIVLLPDVDRVSEVEIDPPLVPGRYRITAELETPEGTVATATTVVWLWDLTTGLLVATALLLVAAVLMSRHLRRGRVGSRSRQGGAG